MEDNFDGLRALLGGSLRVLALLISGLRALLISGLRALLISGLQALRRLVLVTSHGTEARQKDLRPDSFDRQR